VAVLKFKRSSMPGAVPATLEPGEIAINDHDGKVFLTREGQVIELGSQIDRYPGEIILSANPELGPPAYVPADGSTFELGVYPKLDEVFGVEGGSSWDSATKLANPDVLPTGTGRGASFSPDGNYLAIAHDSSPFVTIYKREGDTFTKLANPNVLPPNVGRGASFSPDGNYLAIAHYLSPYVTIYKRNGDSFTKLANPDVIPTGNGWGASFSPDGNYLAIAHESSPFVTIYKRNGDSFTKLANPDVLPTGTGRGASFSPDGNYLAIAHFSSPFVTIYKRNGDSFTKLANPDVLPTSAGYVASFSPDGNYLAIGHNISPYVTIYKREGDTFTKLVNPDVIPTGIGWGASFSPDGNYLVIVHTNSPYVTIYKREGDTFTKLANPDVLPTGNGNGASFSPDGNYLVIAHFNSPYATIYKPGSATVVQLPDIPSPDDKSRYLVYTGEQMLPYTGSVELLLNFEGQNGGTVFVDSSPRNREITVLNNVTTSTAISPWSGESCGRFQGSSGIMTNGLRLNGDSNIFPGTRDFTIEFAMYPLDSSEQHIVMFGLFGSGNDTIYTIGLSLTSTPSMTLCFRKTTNPGNNINNILVSNNTVKLNEWSHVAFTRKEGVLRVFINGVLSGSTELTDDVTPTDLVVSIGQFYRNSSSMSYPYQGYLDDLRITNDYAWYVTDFTPPTLLS